MNSEQQEVSYMKKIGLSVEALCSDRHLAPQGGPFDWKFIFGVGTEGITLFEKALFAKRPGDEIVLELKPHLLDEMLGHLKKSIQDLLPQEMPAFLKVRVVSVDTPDQRELIRAIADGAAFDGCDCGCGCGC
jgi:hypothetical protein